MLKEGIKGIEEITVTEDITAARMGSGELNVFATPAMVALMEKTAWTSIAPYLEDGCGSVGTFLNIKHTAPTPLGMKVKCESELIKVDGRALTFAVSVFDETGLVGKGEHGRFIVNNEKFQAKADGKKS